MKSVFDKQGHRGCRGLMPENTIPAFLKALDIGVTTLEMDTVITCDKKVIVSHEPFFSHEITTKMDGSFISEDEERRFNIYEMNYAETLQFDVGIKPHPRFPNQQKIKVSKPLLSEVFEQVEFYIKSKSLQRVYYNIETKCLPETDTFFHPTPAEFVDLLMVVIADKGLSDYVTIQSFDIRTLQYLRTNYDNIKISLLNEPSDTRTLQQKLDELGFIPEIYSPDYTTVTDELMIQCKGLGIKIIPWTVNDKQSMELLKKMGVDGIISDYPNIF
jgi:glycerophosphoryl diester phosphodiesterase